MALPSVGSAGLILGVATIAHRKESDLTDQASVPRRPGDTVDIRTTIPSALSDLTAGDPSAGSVSSSDLSASTVTFSVNYPGGTTVTTTISLADFQAALQSNDPSSLGDCECDGQTSYAKDAIEVALGLKPGDADQTSASSAKGGSASSGHPATGSSTPVPAAVTGEDVAVAILQDGKQAESADGRGKDSVRGVDTSAASAARPGSVLLAAATFSGSSNGLTVTLSITAATATSTSVAPSAAAPAGGVDVLA